MPCSIGLYWFRRDLRLDDNPALRQLAGEVDQLICVYVDEDYENRRDRYGYQLIGEHQRGFIDQCLDDLDAGLRRRGNALLRLKGDAARLIPQLACDFEVTKIRAQACPGVYEQRQWRRLEKSLDRERLLLAPAAELLQREQLPFSADALPPHFTPFRRQLNAACFRRACSAPDHLPPAPAALKCKREARQGPQPGPPDRLERHHPWQGGETAGQEHWAQYRRAALASYAHTRNELDGWSFSSKVSPWLATGSLSVARLTEDLRQWEAQHGETESSQQLLSEWLWREFFHLWAEQLGVRLFAFGGRMGRPPLTSHYAQRLQQWVHGETAYPLVNACMNELRQTGYLSNRGRQIAASCLVNELSVDWRYGAAYFQQQLIDHDLAVNWGNWQYIAGVGNDPRGGRHFDLARQTQRFDPEGRYRDRWKASHIPQSAGDSVDAADWPIS